MVFNSALITGANRGIGLGFVVELLKSNTRHVIATCRDPNNAKQLNELAAKHSNLHVLQLEMTDFNRHDSFVAEVDKIVGKEGLTLLIQNAGMNVQDEVEGLKPETLMKIYNVNTISPILLTRKLMPLLKRSVANGERTIASFIGSFLGSIQLNTVAKMHGYRMSKAALNQGVRTMALEYQDEKIEFVVLHPGHVQTDMGTNDGRVKAPVTVDESVKGMLKHLENQELTKDGRVITYDGELLPW